ncbi:MULTISPECIES: CopG family transcriptional regulator [unclassified Sphingomonas]|jgi:hypothetical protein|uniref:CopG family transcriptional regulator n=1 Tax=unclassified Sphingomonas TaxID=196159 RepID=UPI000E1065C7|nr:MULTISPECIES: CopG family transcriptional regulator [unclassified Sphingomonas]AXJ95647.1 CopG family transcriptional regulator [Sphingomonas sp. FARSPH]
MDPDDQQNVPREAADNLFDDPDMVDRLDARGYGDITAGRLLGNEAVALWLGLWGTQGGGTPPWR